MENDSLLELIHSMIVSSTKTPKFAVLSSAKIAQLTNSTQAEVEKRIDEFVNAGKLVRSKLDGPLYYDIYLQP